MGVLVITPRNQFAVTSALWKSNMLVATVNLHDGFRSITRPYPSQFQLQMTTASDIAIQSAPSVTGKGPDWTLTIEF